MRTHYYVSPDGTTTDGISLSEVKKLMKKNGGQGYTQHFDRDGSLQECTPIVLGNNADTTYRAKYNTSRCYRIKNKPRSDRPKYKVDTYIVFDKVIRKASALSLGENDNIPILDMLLPLIPEARRIIDTWLDSALCQIHSALYHEFRSMNHYLHRSQDIKKWKAVQPVYPDTLDDLSEEILQSLLYDEAVRLGMTIDNYIRQGTLATKEEQAGFIQEMVDSAVRSFKQFVKANSTYAFSNDLRKSVATKLSALWFK